MLLHIQKDLFTMALKSFKPTAKLSFRRRQKPLAELSIPAHFRCPISLDLMQDPVTLPTGITYDRQSIESWLGSGHSTCPVTNQPLLISSAADGLIPNHSIRRMIQDWCVAHRNHGVERIPTPKTPVTSLQVTNKLFDISDAIRRGDHARCSELVAVLKSWADESERNRQCISSNGAARVLADLFRRFQSDDFLTAFAGMAPTNDEEALLSLASDQESLKSIVSILSQGSSSARHSAVLIMNELLAAAHETEQASIVAGTHGLVDELVKLIKEPISPHATKASLISVYYLASSKATKLLELGLVEVLLEMLIDAEKSLCEKALAVLDVVLGDEPTRQRAVAHALAVPVLVKKMFRVSDTATELVVSAIWKLCRKGRDSDQGGSREECVGVALQAGAFQKLLLLLQVGCSDSTKKKASELLKLLNGYPGREECVETLDFRGLKRQF